MDAQWVYLSLLLILILLLFPLVLYLSFRKTQGKLSAAAAAALPPGRTGWPFIGESLEFVWAGMKGHPERFVFDRMAAFSSKVFRTSIMGEPTAVFCGAAGNKFLFTNESKLVTAWWPSGVNKIFPTTTQSSSSQESLKMRRQLPNFLNPQALRRHVPVMDAIARRHFADDWEGRDSVTVFPLAKRFTFWVACRLFMSVEEPSRVAEFAAPFELLATGILSMPVDLPGTRFGRAVRASRVIRKQLVEIIKQRRAELAEGKTSAEQDILSHMVAAADEEGKPIFSSDLEVADKIIGLLIGGHDTASAACTFLVKYLADFPHVYDKVYNEQMGIAKSKEEGDPLNWDDLQNMRYSWNVACEVLRLASPLPGAFREALTDFIFEGFYVPKGWKLYWSAYATHKNPKHFPEPEKFDPGRFEGKGPEPYTFVPFGGGPRMCPGKEYARLEILVFTYHLVKRFRCRNLAADGRITVNPLPAPAEDLPVRLYPHPAN